MAPIARSGRAVMAAVWLHNAPWWDHVACASRRRSVSTWYSVSIIRVALVHASVCHFPPATPADAVGRSVVTRVPSLEDAVPRRAVGRVASAVSVSR